MITFKRLANDATALALYYEYENGTIRYELDKDLYGKLPKLTWSKKVNTLVSTVGHTTLAIFIATGGAKTIGRRRFIKYIDGNKYNLRKSNLQILDTNTYIENGDETLIYVYSARNPSNPPNIVKIDTIYAEKVKQYAWFISSKGYAYNISKDTNTTQLHRLIISFTEELNEELVIDHIDHNKLNNCKSNLRQVSSRINAHNRHYMGKPDGSVLGVSKRGNVWIAHGARPNEKNKTRMKQFNINKFGEEKAFQLALQQRKEWDEELEVLSCIKI